MKKDSHLIVVVANAHTIRSHSWKQLGVRIRPKWAWSWGG